MINFGSNLFIADIDDCDGINCNDGTCVDGVNDWQCECDSGFTGDLCETSTHTFYFWNCKVIAL